MEQRAPIVLESDSYFEKEKETKSNVYVVKYYHFVKNLRFFSAIPEIINFSGRHVEIKITNYHNLSSILYNTTHFVHAH